MIFMTDCMNSVSVNKEGEVANIIGIISFYDKLCRKSICQVHPCHVVHGLRRKMTIVIQEIATPSLERSTGSYCK